MVVDSREVIAKLEQFIKEDLAIVDMFDASLGRYYRGKVDGYQEVIELLKEKETQNEGTD